MKKFLTVISALFIVVQTNGQYEKPMVDEQNKFEYYFNSAFGYYLPINHSKFLADRGAANAFSFQLNYRSNYFARLYFDMSTVGYHKDNMRIGNVSATLDYKLNANNVGLDLGYTFPIRKFSPFAYGGTGISFMDVPGIKNGSQPNEITFGTKNQSFLQLRGGLGVDYEISYFFIIYLEGQYSSTLFKTVLDDRPLQGINLLIGFKTFLK
ncbi:outer membrane beta-barrel protein [Chitinophaga sancti]|uniref:Outer membrane beta-barrel protein n=1 Tax=Chitinophaga sancti TaxID=1004 RepID=A0A1K1RTA1_9BACT|nr:outer membrane beta-barrel protein [Chitinophaga sancti]WQD62442.1 outer membrane beta-barrel protein [Chitinophaga sancti]WQG91989.1 outer membrane beta-barrel protein [Chitinophaga sancti]SFW75106.1 Outer membrane protein beta-barrel domain-containing protein [Chitinophaga sancti]